MQKLILWLLFIASATFIFENVREINYLKGEKSGEEIHQDGHLRDLYRVRLTKEHGHFKALGVIKRYHGQADVDFLVDTGASSIFLSHNRAKALGVNLKNLNYNIYSNTANATIRCAQIVLDEVRIGPIVAYKVHATVPMDDVSRDCLLGMSFLNRLKYYKISNGVLEMEGFGEMVDVDKKVVDKKNVEVRGNSSGEGGGLVI